MTTQAGSAVSDAELTADTAMKLAASWYSNYGPFRHMYTMNPMKAFQNAPDQWSIKFTVEPPTQCIYFRRFFFTKNQGSGEWEVDHWSEDPARPDEDYVADDDVDDDDEYTIDAEERLAEAGPDEGEDELAALEADNELSVEELRKKYGYGGSLIAADTSDNGAASEDVPDLDNAEQGTSRYGRRRRRKARPAAQAGTDTMADQEQPATDALPDKPSKGPAVMEEQQGVSASASDLQDEGQKRRLSVSDGEGQVVSSLEPTAKRIKLDTADALHGNDTSRTTLPANGQGVAPADDPVVQATANIMSPPQEPATAPSQPRNGTDSDDDSDAEEDPTLPDYFRPDYHKDDLEEFVEDSYKEPRIGPEYQADIPQLDASTAITSYATQGQCCWRPAAGRIETENLNTYLRQARDLHTRWDEPLEAAYEALYATDFDMDRAKQLSPQILAQKTKHVFTIDELDKFEEGLTIYGKHFGKIQRFMGPQFSVQDIVKCYYTWKRTERYDHWIRRGCGFRGVIRYKHACEPGLDEEEFENLVHQRHVERHATFGEHHSHDFGQLLQDTKPPSTADGQAVAQSMKLLDSDHHDPLVVGQALAENAKLQAEGASSAGAAGTSALDTLGLTASAGHDSHEQILETLTGLLEP